MIAYLYSEILFSIIGSDVNIRNSTAIGTAPDSFTYSPDGRNLCSGKSRTSGGLSPLQDFMRSQNTNQMVKYQKIMEETNRKMRDIQVDLDQEKSETLYLRKEVETLQVERDRLKRSLEDARQKLFKQPNQSFDER